MGAHIAMLGRLRQTAICDAQMELAASGRERDTGRLFGEEAFVIELVHVADLRIRVGQPIEIGETAMGVRRVVPILGGEVSGPRLRGRILPAGDDFQLIRADKVTELHARYVIETDGGGRIYIENSGLRHGTAEAMERLLRGESADPSQIYFRTTAKFETNDESSLWLARHIFVGTGVRHPDRVHLSIYQVL
jgi:hypothetical protein